MGADKSFLNAEGMWYVGDTPLQIAHLIQSVATVMPGEKRPAAKSSLST